VILRRRGEPAALAAAAALLLAWVAWGEDTPTAPDAADEPGLGSTEQQLRARFGAELRELEIERKPPPTGLYPRPELPPEVEAAAPPPSDPYADQTRLVRNFSSGDVRSVEYQLFRGKVYRIRWQLAERFEQPLMPHYVAHLTARYGEPGYDQTFKAKLRPPKSDLRRSGWERDGRALELRMLNPLSGGPLYLTLSDSQAILAIGSARGRPQPEPVSSGPWYERPQRAPHMPTDLERRALLEALDGVLARVRF
jgi:hypothetical protein